ncbi:MAG TPA: hypothetical protein VEY49_02845 [Solirubrobacteraceae bacterium]|nr:hypothetical protein [Solirubrobacteraceae bacterium]
MAAVAAVLLHAAPAQADDPVVTIVGDPVVGATLTAIAVVEDDAEAITYAWRRCETVKLSSCQRPIEGAVSAIYTPVAADVGWHLRARARAGDDASKWSAPTAAVQPAPPPPPPPPPTPSPSPQPSPSPTQSQSFPPNVPPPAAPAEPTSLVPRYLDPFPTVRIRGSIGRRGANVNLLRVSAPRDATVKIRCSGSRCPVRRRTRGPGRIRKFERFLPAGLEITIRVRRPALVGKYVRLKVRAGLPPARQDACVMPGSSRPVACPAQ